MTVKEFLENRTLVALEVAEDVLLSIVTEDTNVQVNSDTSSLVMGTPVQEITNFTLTDDNIIVGNLTFDINLLTVNSD